VGIALGLSDVVLAVVVFVLFARPEQSVAFAAWMSGASQALYTGGLDSPALARLDFLGRRLRRGLLAFLFAWSFVCGAAIGLGRV
jgi:hypothetical protein